MGNEIFNEENNEFFEDGGFVIHHITEQQLDLYEPEWRLDIDIFKEEELLH